MEAEQSIISPFLLHGFQAPINSRPSSSVSRTPKKTSHRHKRPSSVIASFPRQRSVVNELDRTEKSCESSDEISREEHQYLEDIPKLEIFIPPSEGTNSEDFELSDSGTTSDDNESEVTLLKTEEEELEEEEGEEELVEEERKSEQRDESISPVRIQDDTLSVCSSFGKYSCSPDSLLADLENGKPAVPNGHYEDIFRVLSKLENERDLSSSLSSEGGRASTKNSKLNNLMTYLEDVETSTKNAEHYVKAYERLEDNNEDVSRQLSSNESKTRQLLKKTPNEMVEEIMNLTLTVEEHQRAEDVLKQALEHQRQLAANSTNRFQREMNMRLKTQKQEYEAAISRHQNFIDQLIEDKRILGERCDNLVTEQKNSERKYEDGIRSLEQRHSAEIRRLRSLHESSTKLRQEKWIDEKTKRIKEQTVRGLEPELQRLMNRHSAEIKEMEAERVRCLQQQEKELHQRHLQHVRELRESWEQEQQDSLFKERQLAANRHAQHLEELHRCQREEMERLQEKLNRERERNSDERGHFEREAEQVRRIAQERANDEIERIRDEEENKRKILIKKHSNELSTLRESESDDRAEWERNCRTRLDDEWKKRESELRDLFKNQRDAELDRVINRLESDLTKCKRDAEKEMEERITRVRNRLDADIKDANEELETIRDKLAKTREDLAKKEEENLVLMAMAKQKELLAEETQKINSKLESEREDIRKAVYGEFSSTMETLSSERSTLLQEVGQLRMKMAEMQSQMENEAHKHRIESEEEVEKIHSRVKNAILKKDEILEDLRSKLEKALNENEHLEALLRRQTEEKVLKKR